MRNIKLFIVGLMLLLVAACYEINEEIVINRDGSGTYVTKMDMSAMLEMMKTFGAGEEELQKSGLGRAIDTVISMKSILDSAGDVPMEQRRLLEPGVMKLKVDFDNSVMNTDVKFPFNNLKDLQQLMSGAASGGLGEILGKLMTKDGQGGAPAGQGFGHLDEVFTVTVTDKRISREVNRARYDSLMALPEMAQLKQMAGFGIEVWYSSTIKLPRPVKKADNAIVKLSDDKRTVTIKYDLIQLLESPEKFSYAIEY